MHYSPVNNKKIMCTITRTRERKAVCFVARESSVFCGPSTVDVSLEFVSGNIDSLGYTKHTVSLGHSQ